MTSLLDVAVENARRGWYVFPCKPRGKAPAVAGGFTVATLDEAQIRDWWTRMPDANVGIATGPSNLCVVDIDHGIADLDGFRKWRNDFTEMYGYRSFAVRTGRRPEFGVQVYFFSDNINEPVKSIAWADGDYSGDIRCSTGYVMAAGSIHPSGEPYAVIDDHPLQLVPDAVYALKPAPITGKTGGTNAAVHDDGVSPISDHRNVHMVSILGKARAAGMDDDELEVFAHDVNERRMTPPLDESELDKILANAMKWDEGDPGPEVILGGKTAAQVSAPPAPVDWRSRYMSADTFRNVKPPEFLIEGFLAKKSIAMLAGPVAQRKSIIALNLAHALCTGDPLFGYFDVSGKPERVIYLCPEMGAASFVKRIKAVGLSDHIGKTLFLQTMSEKPTALDELSEELPGAVVIVDTITRFIDGDENKSEDMRKFAAKVFRLVNAGATVILLHHSKKGSSGSLDDGLRGSSELAAFVDSCWITELEDPKTPYATLSKMRNTKQRDFECDPFKLKPAVGSYFLAMEGEPEPEAVLRGKADDAAREALRVILARSPKLGVGKIREALKAAGHGRGQRWVLAERAALSDGGAALSEGP